MDDSTADERAADSAPRSRRRSRLPISEKAIAYGSDELSSFLAESYESSWEINHTVTPPPL